MVYKPCAFYLHHGEQNVLLNGIYTISLCSFGSLLIITMRFQSAILLAFVPWAGAQVIGISAGVNKNTGERPARQNINDLYAQGGPAW